MRRFLPLLSLVLLSACNNEIDQSTRPSAIVGRYELRSYGGRSLPTVVSTDMGGVTEVTGGELVIGFDLPALRAQFTGVAAGGSVTLSMSDGSTVIYSH